MQFVAKYFTMEKISDLRFIIGLFFGLAGALLFVLSFFTDGGKEFGRSLNQFAGAGMLVFGVFMLWLSRREELVLTFTKLLEV